MKRFLISLIFAVLISFAAFAQERVQLKFLADLNLKTGMTFGQNEIGGLSGAFYDSRMGELYALSDDKSDIGPARIHVFSLAIDESGASPALNLEPKRTVILRQTNGQTFPKGSIDPEGIAPSSRGFFVSQEGNLKSNPRVLPSLLEFAGDGKLIRQIPLPSKALPETQGVISQGMRSNLALEGLTFHTESSELTPLIAAAESALLQDDTVASFTKGSMTRFFCLDPSQLFAVREYAYWINPLVQTTPQEQAQDRGVSEILAIPRSIAPDFSFEPWVLVLERGTTITPTADPENPLFKNQIDLFITQLKDATDVSAIPALQGASFKPLPKKLLLSIHQAVSAFTPGFQSVDNLEALSWGPKLKNGNPTLLILSDNNFNPTQRTQVLAYEWKLR